MNICMDILLGSHINCCDVGCVPKKVSDVDRKRIADLEKSEAILKEEVSKLKVRYEVLIPNVFSTF